MASRIKIKTLENSHTHFDTHKNNYTLCGLETGGDDTYNIALPTTVKRKVNCPACIEIVKFCKAIKETEYEK